MTVESFGIELLLDIQGSERDAATAELLRQAALGVINQVKVVRTRADRLPAAYRYTATFIVHETADLEAALADLVFGIWKALDGFCPIEVGIDAIERVPHDVVVLDELDEDWLIDSRRLREAIFIDLD